MVIELLTAHASVRKYKDNPLSKEEVHELIRAGQHAASSHFVQAYSVIYVTDGEKRKKLAELTKNPQQILSAGAVFVFCTDYCRLKKAANLVGKDIDFSFAENSLSAPSTLPYSHKMLPLQQNRKATASAISEVFVMHRRK